MRMNVPGDLYKPATSKKSKPSAKIAALEAALVDPEALSLNPLADLVAIAQQSAQDQQSAQTTHAAIWALYRVFATLIQRGILYGSASGDKAKKEVRLWLYGRQDEFVALLARLLASEEQAIRDSALRIAFSMIKQLSDALSAMSGTPQLHPFVWKTIVLAVVQSGVDMGEYLKYDDIRWFFFRDISLMMKSADPAPSTQMARNAFKAVESVSKLPVSQKELSFFIPAFAKPPSKSALAVAQAQADEAEPTEEADEDDWRKFFDKPTDAAPEAEVDMEHGMGRAGKLGTHARIHAAPQAHRVALVSAWLAVLPRIADAGEADAARVLSVLHVRLMPHLKKEEAIRTMDWIAGCVDYGDATGLLALNTLFELMTSMNLDYPDLYVRLYAYLDRNILHLKQRARFLRVLERMLSSTHLPATLIASFIKRLARLSLSAPPAAIVAILPLTYNLLKTHPTCMVLIHRDVEPGKDIDPYNANESSPFLSNALDSSLWELESHTSHFHAPTATLARILSEPFTKQSLATEDFLDHSYATMFEAETGGKRSLTIRREPALRDEGDTANLLQEIWV
ncbi:CBF-domain-containing protein [Auriculariales sp. MPI-PUGE-AT-0066]|nr:CBF-domain-containing protein [Auriculariales sp. MPI-PUGE-AT-0066]